MNLAPSSLAPPCGANGNEIKLMMDMITVVINMAIS